MTTTISVAPVDAVTTVPGRPRRGEARPPAGVTFKENDVQHQWINPHASRPCDRPGCMWCDGGLEMCERCHSFEGGTTSECPGSPMTYDQIDAVYAGELDFVDGAWRTDRRSPWTPNGRNK